MDIKRLAKTDIETALELVRQVFMEFEAPDYSETGIAVFHDFISYPNIAEKFDKDEILFWGCFVDGNLAGVIALRDASHICLLFVKKEVHRQGIARSLFSTIVKHCSMDERIERITVHSSPYAVEAYRRLGFRDIGGEQTINGIRFTAMDYRLK